jgi:EAL domain-containing protein (putative c-di-GMP-specific phosphodiesterase class I)
VSPRLLLTIGFTVVLGTLLAATVVWTHFDPRWITFLGGVLFAAVLATASQVSRAEWRILRRDRHIARLRQRLEEETALRKSTEAALQAYEQRAKAADLPEPPHAEETMPWTDPRERLQRALRDDEFLLFGQRIAPLGAGRPMCEVLLRLKEEEDNFLPPGGFFPAAERYGMMESLDRWVVSHLMRRRERGAPLYCVNLSTAAVTSAEFAAFVEEHARERKFDARGLCFEVAEVDLIAHNAAVRSLVERLRALGCRFTVDAFGSVKGTFAALRGVAVDFVKIDGVIVQNLGKAAEFARARAMVAVCGKLGIRTIAEFVEDDAMRNILRGLGVDYVQGFGVSAPAPLAGLPAVAALAA